MALDFAVIYKVLVLGDSNVGKTCIVHRYCDERYYDTYISTIGIYLFIYYLNKSLEYVAIMEKGIYEMMKLNSK